MGIRILLEDDRSLQRAILVDEHLLFAEKDEDSP